MDIVQLHFLTPYPASCLVRGNDGRPKMLKYGGVDRARISSAALKRAIRTSTAFQESLGDNIGVRTARVGTIVSERLQADGIDAEKSVEAARLIAGAFGKAEAEGTETGQLVFVSHQEIDAATALAKRIATGELELSEPDQDGGKAKKGKKPKSEGDDLLRALLSKTTSAADIAMFGRMFASRGELRMTAACEVAHPFTVDRASLESDFFVAVDDEKPAEQDVGAEFIGEQFFTAGLFYGYARIDMDQLASNLGGDSDLAALAARSFARGCATVSPVGKKAAFGTHARAVWMMAERGTSSPRSLAGAFLKPVDGDDHLTTAVENAEGFANAMNAAYGDRLKTIKMNVATGEGSLDDVLTIFGDQVSG